MSEIAQTDITGPIYFFGDSLSDPGNLADQASNVLPPETVESLGDDGRASNGPVWTEVVPGLLGVTGTSYAVAGAEAVGSQTIGAFIDEAGLSGELTVLPDDDALDWDMNLGAQIDRFVADVAGDDLTNATAVIFIGGNDYGGIELSSNPIIALAQITQALTGIVQSTMDAVSDLDAMGVGDIVVTSLPSFTFFPAILAEDPEVQASAEQLVNLHNDALKNAVEDAEANGMPVRFVDMRGITDAIVDDPSSFGLIAPYELTLIEGDPQQLAAFDEDQVAFWDALHPTEATHGVMAAYMSHALVSAPITGGPGDDDVLSATAGGDIAFLYGGADRANGGLGDDILFGGSGIDDLFGSSGNDLLSGGSDKDYLVGNTGSDLVAGGEGDDLIRGGFGDDVLIDGLGDDAAHGGHGNDTFIWLEGTLIGSEAPQADEFFGFRGTDTAYLVLSEASYDLYAVALSSATPGAALSALGLELTSIEDIVVLEGRASLDTAFSAEDWYADADIWGLL